MQEGPIRVLHCVAGMGMGGYENLIMNVYRNIDRTKVQFDFLLSFDGIFCDEIRKMGGHIYQIPFITQSGPFVYRAAVQKILREHSEYKIVHSHMDKFSGLIMETAKHCGVPVRVAHSHNIQSEGGFAFQLIKNYYGRKIESNCTHCFACAEAAARWLFPQRHEEAVLVKNGIPLLLYRQQDSRNPANLTVGLVARFVPAKNHAFLIDIFHELKKLDPSAKLVLVGDGQLLAQMQQRVAQQGLADSISFLGMRRDIPQILATLDVFCMPSLFEGLPVSLVEAQAAGLPCVVSEAITAEAAITKDTIRLSLERPASVWAKTLLQKKGLPRADNLAELRAQGYDIVQTAAALQEFYESNGYIQ